MPSRVLILILACLTLVPSGFCQERRMRRAGPNPRLLERLEKMTPEQRQRVLDRLPPERRANVERKLNQYESLPPEERTRVRQNFERFRNLPPERQEAARRLFVRLQEMPRERRLAVREEFRTIRQLRPTERGPRLNGEDFKARFSPDERRWVRDALETMRP